MQNIDAKKWLAQHFSRNVIVTESCLPVEDRDQMMKLLRSLCQSQRLSRWVHVSQLVYWTQHSTRSLSDSSLVRAYSFLRFGQQSEQRRLVTHQEIARWFPNLFRHGLPSGHYLDRNDGTPRLGRLRVDAQNSKINRLTSRTARLIQSCRQQPEFRKLIDGGHFELTWIVATQAKQQRLVKALAPLTTSGIQFRVVVIPELLNLLAPISPN